VTMLVYRARHTAYAHGANVVTQEAGCFRFLAETFSSLRFLSMKPATAKRVFHAFQLGEAADNAQRRSAWESWSANELRLAAVTTRRLPGELMERYREVTLVRKPNLMRYFGD